ncbi:hypothetical protein GE061_017812 [Apolygus lucorum]|uniref:Uncharacterized protein n=1 Tax=Apolygus lucorum TaxID=248454 RepID=A0A8S9XE63_APOLU|nr:hypothetical protein GE061_017812 [Apolygus lucorum]
MIFYHRGESGAGKTENTKKVIATSPPSAPAQRKTKLLKRRDLWKIKSYKKTTPYLKPSVTLRQCVTTTLPVS